MARQRYETSELVWNLIGPKILDHNQVIALEIVGGDDNYSQGLD